MVNDAVELEAMRKVDSSWHPCQVSLTLSPSGVGLIVEYGDNDSDHVVLDKEEALKFIRVRSLHLQGDDCPNIKQGEHVLATQELQAKNLFFDAEVKKVVTIRHSKRIHCRCTFIVKWLNQDFKETFSVPASSIMKLSTKSINVHPTISKFLNSVRTLTCSSVSPLPTLVKDTDSEMDLHELLEKQIEDISNSVDDSKNKTRRLPLGVEVDTKSESQIQVTQNQNPLKRSTRSIKVRDPPPSPQSIQEDFPENRSTLSPLAARAALASLMSKLPRNLEFSIYREGQKCFTYSSDVDTQKQVTVESIANNSSMIDKLCSKIEDGSVPFGTKNKSIVKSLFLKTSASTKKRAGIQVDIEEMKLRCGTNRRLTRSAARKEEEAETVESTKELEENISAKFIQCDSYDQNDDTEEKRKTMIKVERNKKNLSDTRRLTRSAVCLEVGNKVTGEVIRGLEENNVCENEKPDLYVGEKKRPISTPLNKEIILSATEERSKKWKMANAGNGESSQVLKRKSTISTKPALRSSPRFNILPRTRSQNKS